MALKQAHLAAVEYSDAIDMAPLESRLEQIGKQIDEQLHLQKVALLEEGHILRFHGPRAQRLALSLPDAQEDYVQRLILKNRGFYEAKQLAQLETFGIVGSKSVVCDIGANIGNHAVYFARVMGAAKVLAFEPMAHSYATLCKNILLNQAEDRVLAYDCLIGAETGFGEMIRFNPRNLGGTVYAAKEGGSVPLFALDDVLEADDLPNLDLIKIDFEGMQMDVLMGAEGILAKRKPALWVEVAARENSMDAVEVYLEQFGYKSTRLSPSDVLFRA
jgi:FkbM family methyltransferase